MYRGFFVGSILSVRRILRCQPFGGVGYDPVPRRVAWKRIDLIRKKMGDKVPLEPGATSDVITLEKKSKRKVARLLPYRE